MEGALDITMWTTDLAECLYEEDLTMEEVSDQPLAKKQKRDPQQVISDAHRMMST